MKKSRLLQAAPRSRPVGAAVANPSRRGQHTGLYKPRPAGTLKAAVAELVTAAGGLARAADLAGCSKSEMHRYTDDALPEYRMPVDTVRALERVVAGAGGEPVVTMFLANELGAVLLRLPAVDTALDRDLAAFGREVAEVFARYAESIADGRIAGRESGELIREIDDVLAAASAVRADLMRRADPAGQGSQL